jgi:hypothetical protein
MNNSSPPPDDSPTHRPSRPVAWLAAWLAILIMAGLVAWRGGEPTAGLAILIVGGLVVGLVAGTRTDRRSDRERQQRQLKAYMFGIGWRPLAGSVPPIVAEATRSSRNKLAMTTERDGRQLWMVWHHWVDYTGQAASEVELTRYFTRLETPRPDLRVRRRTSMGARLIPVRGAGTGDAAFDKAFLIRPVGNRQIPHLFGPRLRQEMLESRPRGWQITSGILIVEHKDVPDTSNIQPCAHGILRVAELLG